MPAVPLPALASLAAAPAARHQASAVTAVEREWQADRVAMAALRALVDGVELIGRLPDDRGTTRHRVRILPRSGAPILANLNVSLDRGIWVSIEKPGLPQDLADRLAAAALVRLKASDLALVTAGASGP